MKYTKYVVLIFCLIFNYAVHADTDEVTWSFTIEQFKNEYNQQAVKDEGYTIKSIKYDEGSWLLTLNNTKFQKGVAEMKNLDLMNGKFTLETYILLTIEKNKKVKSIIISGDRSDPVNLSSLIDTVGTVIKVLNPAMSQDEVTSFLVSLGLMRGDDDPTIGEPITQLNKGGAFTCNNQLHDTSTVVGCWIVPRS
jgi:hypothetical protein